MDHRDHWLKVRDYPCQWLIKRPSNDQSWYRKMTFNRVIYILFLTELYLPLQQIRSRARKITIIEQLSHNTSPANFLHMF